MILYLNTDDPTSECTAHVKKTCKNFIYSIKKQLGSGNHLQVDFSKEEIEYHEKKGIFKRKFTFKKCLDCFKG